MAKIRHQEEIIQALSPVLEPKSQARIWQALEAELSQGTAGIGATDLTGQERAWQKLQAQTRDSSSKRAQLLSFLSGMAAMLAIALLSWTFLRWGAGRQVLQPLNDKGQPGVEVTFSLQEGNVIEETWADGAPETTSEEGNEAVEGARQEPTLPEATASTERPALPQDETVYYTAGAMTSFVHGATEVWQGDLSVKDGLPKVLPAFENLLFPDGKMQPLSSGLEAVPTSEQRERGLKTAAERFGADIERLIALDDLNLTYALAEPFDLLYQGYPGSGVVTLFAHQPLNLAAETNWHTADNREGLAAAYQLRLTELRRQIPKIPELKVASCQAYNLDGTADVYSYFYPEGQNLSDSYLRRYTEQLEPVEQVSILLLRNLQEIWAENSRTALLETLQAAEAELQEGLQGNHLWGISFGDPSLYREIAWYPLISLEQAEQTARAQIAANEIWSVQLEPQDLKEAALVYRWTNGPVRQAWYRFYVPFKDPERSQWYETIYVQAAADGQR